MKTKKGDLFFTALGILGIGAILPIGLVLMLFNYPGYLFSSLVGVLCGIYIGYILDAREDDL